MTAANGQHTGAAAARDRDVGMRLVSSRRRPPAAFYGVPAASDKFNSHVSPSASGRAVLVKPQNILPGMEVYDYHGMYVGFVTDVLDDSALLVRRRWHPDRRVPLEQVMAVFEQRVVLSVPRAHVGVKDRAA